MESLFFYFSWSPEDSEKYGFSAVNFFNCF